MPVSPPSSSRATRPAADTTLAWRSIDTIRALSMDAVQAANSGHPGTPMALAPAAYVLWQRFLRHNPKNPDWADRDRFVLSCGHASMLIYSLLHLTGYDLPMEELRNFRQWGSMTPGHPERGHTPGVEVTTGPLGQGLSNAVGMAIAQRFLAGRFNQPDFPVMDHRIWGFASDGDLMEGVASEAASLAGHLGLSALTFIYDNNHITIDGSTSLAFTEDVGTRFSAYGWHVLYVEDANDLDAIAAALEAAAAESNRPTLIVMRSIIGDPAPTKRDTASAHGSPLGEEEVRRTKEVMGWTEPPFTVPQEVSAHMGGAVAEGARLESAWNELMDGYRKTNGDLAREFEQWWSGKLPAGWDRDLPEFTPEDGSIATRKASNKILNALHARIPNLIGGSADLAESTGTHLKGAAEMGPEGAGPILHFGVREHGMGASMNGMAAHGGVRPFGSTFLIFFDYMKPAVRLAALSRLPVIFIGTHDSVGLGEDGPTHQPVEQLAMLRAIPNLVVLRPADANETREAWCAALGRTEGPTALVLTRQGLPVLDRATLGHAEGVRRGGYVLYEPKTKPVAILLATGSEVQVALEAAEALSKDGAPTRVVSLPSWELFESQPESYRDDVLPPGLTVRVSIEAATSFGWERFLGREGRAIALDHFGASAPGKRVLEEFGFTADHVTQVVRDLLEAS